jgi:hypothetical protein
LDNLDVSTLPEASAASALEMFDVSTLPEASAASAVVPSPVFSTKLLPPAAFAASALEVCDDSTPPAAEAVLGLRSATSSPGSDAEAPVLVVDLSDAEFFDAPEPEDVACDLELDEPVPPGSKK